MKKISLTPLEKELMAILWQIEEGTVHDVMENYPRELAYNSISTILRILVEKKLVKTKKLGRQHIYVPLISREAFAKSTLNELVSITQEPLGLINYLLNSKALKKEDIQALEKLIDEKLKENS